jgi:hypothetical protein
MGVESKTVIKITCDNPNCPGTDLPDAKSYDGWYRVSATTQHTPPAPTTKDGPQPFAFPISLGEKIYCSAACAGTVADAIVTAEEALAARDQIDSSLPEPV